MSQYEMCIVTREEKDVVAVKKELEDFGVKILFEQKIGRKKFAYPIIKERAGFYQSIYFNIDGKKIAALSKKLQSESTLLRFLMIKNEIDIKKLSMQEKSKLVQEKNLQQTIIPEKTEEPKKGLLKEEIIDLEKKQKIKKEEKSKIKEKVRYNEVKQEINKEKNAASELEEERIKKLDEKLDELLKE